MNHHQHEKHENQSDTDEGFVPSKNVVKEKKTIVVEKIRDISEDKHTQNKQFVPRYIFEGIMRKQPSQCYERFSQFDHIDIQSEKQAADIVGDSLKLVDKTIQEPLKKGMDSSQKKVKVKQKCQTPYDRFIESGDYNLVYARYKDFKFSNEEFNFANNCVKLDCLRSCEQFKSKHIKPFEKTQTKGNEINRNMARNTSYKQSILQFDSKFECGNLLCAFKHKKDASTYSLFIQNDSNTYGYNHWFYFSVKNAQVGTKYRFHIVNFRKRHSFFKDGNKPVIFSLLDSRKPNLNGYSKRGDNIKYEKSSIVKHYNSKQKFYELSFTLEFWNQNDTFYISTGLPYSYSKLLNHLNTFEQIAKSKGLKWQMQSIGTSVAGNNIPYVTITKFQDEQRFKGHVKGSKSYCYPAKNYENQEDQDEVNRIKTKHMYSESPVPKKRVIFLIARQHPGETWSSYLMHQFLHNLIHQNTQQSRYILNNFIIKCIPMINVDGVIAGNFRCDLTGMDLNRNWKNPSAILHPQIFSLKNEIISLMGKGYQIQTFIDFHGHSKQFNFFCYSCKTDNFECRILPYLFSQYNKEFHFPFCTFGISREKLSTARAVMFDLIRNPNILTIESSFFGSKIDGKISCFEPKNFSHFSSTLLKGLKSYFYRDELYYDAKETIKLRINQFLSYKNQNDRNILSGSDSEPSGDQMQISQKLQKIIPKILADECLEIQQMKKAQKKAIKKAKKQAILQASEKQSSKKQSRDSSTKNGTFDLFADQSPSKSSNVNIQPIRKTGQFNKTIHFKNRSFVMSSKTIDQSQLLLNNSKDLMQKIMYRQEHKLPFFSRQKSNMVPMKLKNESLQIFKDAYNATENMTWEKLRQTNLDTVQPQRRNTSRKLAIYKEKALQKDTDEFPLLCVLSENRKKRQIQMMTQQKEDSIPSIKKRGNSPEKVKTAIQARTQAIKQLRDRNKGSIDLVSKVWKDNWNRYGMGYTTFKIAK